MFPTGTVWIVIKIYVSYRNCLDSHKDICFLQELSGQSSPLTYLSTADLFDTETKYLLMIFKVRRIMLSETGVYLILF
jgi:hypothetical protein